jgi:hypothetical protein
MFLIKNRLKNSIVLSAAEKPPLGQQLLNHRVSYLPA